jgi:hypothetical protein
MTPVYSTVSTTQMDTEVANPTVGATVAASNPTGATDAGANPTGTTVWAQW